MKNTEMVRDTKALQNLMRSFLWCLVHQSEKVPCDLAVLVDILYPDEYVQVKFQMKDKILGAIQNRDLQVKLEETEDKWGEERAHLNQALLLLERSTNKLKEIDIDLTEKGMEYSSVGQDSRFHDEVKEILKDRTNFLEEYDK